MLPSLQYPGRVLVLVLLASALNFVPIEQPGGALFFLGSFASMPLTLMLPGPWAILAAAVPMACTISQAGHPFFLLLAVLESCWLVSARRVKWGSHLLQDFAFWLVIGGPAIFLLSRFVAGATVDVSQMTMTTVVINQILAVAIGSFISRHTPLADWFERGLKHRVRVREVVFRFVILLAVVPLILVGIMVSALVRNYLERVDREVLLESTQRSAAQMDLFLKTHEAAVTSVAGTLGRNGGDAVVLLEEVRRTLPAFITMLVADAQGRVRHTAVGTAMGGLTSYSVADREYFRKARDLDRPFVSGVFRGQGLGTDIFVEISAPIHGPNGEFAGIVQAALEVKKFASSVAAGCGVDDALLILLDADGRVIHADVGTCVPIFGKLKYYSHGVLLDPLRFGRRVEFDHLEGMGGVDREVGFAVRSATGIVVLAHRPLISALSSVVWIVGFLIGITGGMTLVALFLARTARTRVALPLETFARAASRQAALGIVEPISNPTNDAPQEIVLVFNAFNNLAVRLTGTYQMLRQQNQELDQRVVERTQELETARAQAVATSEAKSAFLAMTSHEIRTPLNAIIGLAEALREKATDELTASRLLTIRTSGQRLVAVVNDLLDLSTVEAGKLELRTAPFELVAMCEEIRRLFALRVEQQGLQLAVEIPAGPIWCETDGIRLQQVLINLIGNSLKFTKVGSITLRVALDSVGFERLSLRFSVIDTGTGISDAEQAKLFQPYVQLSGSTTSNVRGTGLGLSISRRLVTLLGGSLGVQSRLGEGSEFGFTFETNRCVAPVISAVTTATPFVRRLRVLAADDNLANREVLGSILETRCDRVELVDCAQSALDLLARETFDVVLVDLNMPDADGFSVARAVRSWSGNEASRGCRLVAFSAYSRDQVWSRCTEAGFDDFVEKPIDRSALLNALGHSQQIAAP